MSSEIENIVTMTDRLFRFANEANNQADPATKEALWYRTALSEGFQTLNQRPVSSTAIAVCRTTKGVELDIRATPGTALMNEATGAVIDTPLEGQAGLADAKSLPALIVEWRHRHPIVRDGSRRHAAMTLKGWKFCCAVFWCNSEEEHLAALSQLFRLRCLTRAGKRGKVIYENRDHI